ncbi:hypothetical protein M407DRAFT_31006 [Tulasnella calospora MUT 4182]|uniref:Uncharacterized protein n=1 Tax=Tulasnella calospora MUT 4182 TaxID=1051891 RepID=A0A0C3LD57_9AGAM|nr:hypothetical protein M407DRAFT_31006 [Tulasnella calospora MUT 4182]
MRPSTRSQIPPSNSAASAEPATQPPHASNRKRKASNPPTLDPAPAPTSASTRKAKKKRTQGPSTTRTNPPTNTSDQTPDVPTQEIVAQALPLAPASTHPAPSHPDGSVPRQSIVIDPALLLPAPPSNPIPLTQPFPLFVEPIPPVDEPLPPLNDLPADADEPAGSNDTALGDATRNRGQRAPTLREQNAAQAKTIAELEAKVKQLSSDIRTLKKYKVMWVKEYSKKAKSDAGPADSLIPRPPGEKGKNGWNLRDAMGLKDDEALYTEILEATYSEQEPGRLAACFKELKREHPYLNRFQGDWPAKEMVISALQNRRKTISAKAKAKVSTDRLTQAQLMAAAAEVEVEAAE